MSVNLNNMMGGFDEVSPGGLGIYLEPGNFGLQIQEAKNGHAPNGGFDFFVAEFVIVHSTNPMRPVGSRVEWMVAFKNPQYKQTYQANVKRFLHAAISVTDPTWTIEKTNTQAWMFATSQQQPLRGIPVLAECFSSEKRHSKGEFINKTHFKPWPSGPLGPEALAQALAAVQPPPATAQQVMQQNQQQPFQSVQPDAQQGVPQGMQGMQQGMGMMQGFSSTQQ